MNQVTAQMLMAAIKNLDHSLGEISAIIELIDNMDEKKTFRRSIAEMMGDADGKLIRPILRQYPDLDPDK